MTVMSLQILKMEVLWTRIWPSRRELATSTLNASTMERYSQRHSVTTQHEIRIHQFNFDIYQYCLAAHISREVYS